MVIATSYNLSLARNWARHHPQSEGLPLFENYDAFMVPGQQYKTTCNREGILPMSIGFSGLDTPCCVQPVTIDVSPAHPLIQLAQVLPWQTLADMVLPDLQRTTAQGKWWLGRKLRLRIHLGALLLQWLYHLTDRQVEWAIKDNAVAYLGAADNVLGSLASYLSSINQPDLRTRNAFSTLISPS